MRTLLKNSLGGSLLAMIAAATAASCVQEAPKPSGLMVAFRTDMRVPEYVDEVGVFIEQSKGTGGNHQVFSRKVKARIDEATGENTVRLPAELAVQASGALDERVRVQVIAYGLDGAPLVLREARVSMPQGRVALLPLPLLWINSGEAQLAGAAQAQSALVPQGRVALISSCGEDETLNDVGECVSIDIDESSLADWSPARKIETSESQSAGAHVSDGSCCERSCYDVQRCLALDEAQGVGTLRVTLSADGIDGRCAVDIRELPLQDWSFADVGGRLPLSVGVWLPRNQGGWLAQDNSAEGLLPLAIQPELKGTQMRLPEALCRQAARRGGTLDLQVSARCKPMAELEAQCGADAWLRSGDRQPGDHGACINVNIKDLQDSATTKPEIPANKCLNLAGVSHLTEVVQPADPNSNDPDKRYWVFSLRGAVWDERTPVALRIPVKSFDKWFQWVESVEGATGNKCLAYKEEEDENVEVFKPENVLIQFAEGEDGKESLKALLEGTSEKLNGFRTVAARPLPGDAQHALAMWRETGSGDFVSAVGELAEAPNPNKVQAYVVRKNAGERYMPPEPRGTKQGLALPFQLDLSSRRYQSLGTILRTEYEIGQITTRLHFSWVESWSVWFSDAEYTGNVGPNNDLNGALVSLQELGGEEPAGPRNYIMLANGRTSTGQPSLQSIGVHAKDTSPRFSPLVDTFRDSQGSTLLADSQARTGGKSESGEPWFLVSEEYTNNNNQQETRLLLMRTQSSGTGPTRDARLDWDQKRELNWSGAALPASGSADGPFWARPHQSQLRVLRTPNRGNVQSLVGYWALNSRTDQHAAGNKASLVKWAWGIDSSGVATEPAELILLGLQLKADGDAEDPSAILGSAVAKNAAADCAPNQPGCHDDAEAGVVWLGRYGGKVHLVRKAQP